MSTAEQTPRIHCALCGWHVSRCHALPGRSVCCVKCQHGAPAVGAWVIGHNIAGYLPESDTMAFADRGEAWTALFDEARRYADEDDELWEDICRDGGDHEHGEHCYGTMRATVDAITTDLARDPVPHEGDFSFSVEDYNDRTIVFWLQWEPPRAPGTDDFGYPLN